METHKTPQEHFCNVLATHYTELFKSDPNYAYSASKHTPAELAQKMTRALNAGSGNKAGEGVKRTCKQLGIPYTYKRIKEYFAQLTVCVGEGGAK